MEGKNTTVLKKALFVLQGESDGRKECANA
jgi:hypothetical protein